MKIVHMRTQIITQFGEVQPDGINIKPLQPITFTSDEFSPAAVVDGFTKISAKRNELEAQHAPKPEPPAEGPT